MDAVYDLAKCPPTFDVVAFLAQAELERLRRGDEQISLYVHPGPADGFRRDSHWPHDIGTRIRMRNRVLNHVCKMLPSARHVVPGPGQDLSGAWGYGKYLIGLPRIVDALRQGCRPLRARVGWHSHRPDDDYITFSLREAEHHVLRNSRVGEWRAAADVLRSRGMKVEVLPDNEDLPTRAHLYSQARLNVGISHGPMWLALFMDAPVLMLRPTTNEAGGCYDDAFFARHGVPRGSQLPASPPHQRLVWEDDHRDNIVRAVDEMLEVVS